MLKVEPTRMEREDLVKEAAVMAQFNHEHVLKLIAVVTAGPPMMMIVQFWSVRLLPLPDAGSEAYPCQDASLRCCPALFFLRVEHHQAGHSYHTSTCHAVGVHLFDLRHFFRRALLLSTPLSCCLLLTCLSPTVCCLEVSMAT